MAPGEQAWDEAIDGVEAEPVTTRICLAILGEICFSSMQRYN